MLSATKIVLYIGRTKFTKIIETPKLKVLCLIYDKVRCCYFRFFVSIKVDVSMVLMNHKNSCVNSFCLWFISFVLNLCNTYGKYNSLQYSEVVHR